MFGSEANRRKSTPSIPYLSRRFTGLSIPHGSSESSEELRGPLGLTLLHSPSEPLIDFIFVHGLRGGSRKTWSKTESIAHFWPQQWLPSEPRFKTVRIHSFGYNSDWGERKGSALSVHDFGQALIGDIHTSPHLNQDGNKTPIVLVGHSMGGIVIKKAFLLARQDPNYQQIASRIHSMFFLATPHRGADSAQLLEKLLKVSVSHNNKAYIGDIKPNSGAIQIINDEFRHAYQGVQLWSFFETVATSLGLIVERESAVLGLPHEHVHLLNADHRQVCKFEDPSDSNYCAIRNAFVSAISHIETTYYSAKKDEHRNQMRILSQFLGISEPPEADLINIVDKQAEGSCLWLTSKSSFEEWHNGGEATKFFWLSGEPATGKSVLAGHVIKHLQHCNSDCSYFFFKHGDATKSTVSELLRSLAWQMANVNTAIREGLLEMQQNGDAIDKGDERSLWRTIYVNRILRVDLHQPHRWVIDAVDECKNYSALFHLLAKVDKQFPLHVFLTSRPSPAVDRLFSQEKISKFTAQTTHETSLADIRLYVEAHGHFLPVDEEDARSDLIHQIVTKSNGNFLWVSLVLQELESAQTEAQIRDVLKSVPTKMDEFYHRILNNLLAVPRNVELVKAILRWTVCAARPLTTDELKEALRYDIDEVVPRLEKSASSICGYLVYVDKRMRVQVTHQTVRSFLIREDLKSEFAIVRSKEHSRLANICLNYLSGPEMRPPRHRRGSVSLRPIKRSSFADYAVPNFADHIARCTSAEDTHLLALSSFLQSNVFTWIEVIASTGDLHPLMHTTKHLKTYLERRAKYLPPLGTEVSTISAWTTDFVHLIAEFGKTLLSAPTAIYFLIPPLCPEASMLHKVSQSHPRSFQLEGVLQKDWDDRLSCIILPNTRILSMSCCDNRFAMGAADGIVRVYNTTTFQEEIQLKHTEPVRNVRFANVNAYLASVGRKSIRLWNVVTGIMIWTAIPDGQPLTLEFTEDDAVLMVATQANTLSSWRVADGVKIDSVQFSDIDEEDQTEYHYKRPPTFASLSTGLNLLAVAYRQRPLTFWDLADNALVGQFHKSAATYPWPLIVALLLNPQPEISLAAVAYHGGDIVVFDPFTLRQCATASAEASILASSPDGTVLAAGHGSSGVISLYDFETLKLLYRVNSYAQDIRSIVFASNGLRFFDIRGDHCNVWEPSVLIRNSNTADDSSIGFSEEIFSGPQYVTSRAYDDDLVITALIAHHQGDLIFCGREDGSVAAYSAKTGKCTQELFSQGRNVAVLSLIWNESQNLLAISDRSTRFVVRQVTAERQTSVTIHDPKIDREANQFIHQMLFSPDGLRLLVSTAESDSLWDIKELAQIAQERLSGARPSWYWSTHPSQPDRLLLVCDGRTRIYSWGRLEHLTAINGINLLPPIDSKLAVASVLPSAHGRNLCIRFSSSRTAMSAPRFGLWPSKSLIPEATEAQSIVSYPDLALEMKCIIGLSGSDLVFLDHDGWICSLKVEPAMKERSYIKHFFVPFGWHSARGDVLAGITRTGSVVIAVKDELAVFHNGLECEERVPVGDVDVSARPSMRSTLKRGISEP